MDRRVKNGKVTSGVKNIPHIVYFLKVLGQFLYSHNQFIFKNLKISFIFFSYANLVQNILDLKFQIMEKTGKVCFVKDSFSH